uniref:Uncharacterized protein n=1 Tax=Anguilla anguilla TaxID=7936 RepID=A0A0E9T7M8_ANGAN
MAKCLQMWPCLRTNPTVNLGEGRPVWFYSETYDFTTSFHTVD